MKRTILAIASALSAICLQTSVLAQEHEGCFLIDSQGNIVDLGNLCPRSAQPEAIETIPNNVPTPTSPPVDRPTTSRVVQVPIERRVAGIPIVNVTFNGSATYAMMLDTGASNTVITQTMAQELRVARVGTAIISTASERDVAMDIAYIPSIEIQGIFLRNARVAVAPPDLDIGLLGQDFFGQYDVTIRESVVEFQRRG
ncbi:MAG: retroviral-like aspartic protease family protein [Cyanobacteria bacterium SID2]|nr:retroviral-like aspartic protease family protein [Cyanobacteria bacterium SID2]MBP0002945.1 retroviral-like aspartic protease family protein [Cyanobacteria bacterium SBC]